MLVLSICSVADAAVINFDVWPDGTPIPAPLDPPHLSITDEFKEWGIIFESTTKVCQHSTPPDLDTPPNCLWPDHVEDSITLDAHFVYPAHPDVPGTVTWVQFFQDRGAQSGGGTFIAYDINDTEVINQPFHSSGTTFRYEYPGGIHRIYIGWCKDGLDDLTFSDITPTAEPPCEPADPVAYWPFDGDATDASGNGHDGTVHGATSCDDRCLALYSAYCFDGMDDHVDIGAPSSLRITGALTVAAWFYAKPAALSDPPSIVSRYGWDTNRHWCWGLRLNEGMPQGWISQTGNSFKAATGENVVDSNIWHHLAMTYKPSEFIKLYLDGSLVAENTTSIPVSINDPEGVAIYVGAAWIEEGYIPPGHPFTGTIDEVQIYNRALSECEIQELIEECPTPVRVPIDIKPGSCPNPLNLESKGVVPVAIVNSEYSELNALDPASVRLAGVAPIRSLPKDVTTPVADNNECDCTEAGPDGKMDLTFKFKTLEIVEALLDAQGELVEGQTLVLTLTGEMYDGTPIEGTDCMVLVGKVPGEVAARRADINKDGKVNVRDLFELKKQWGKSTARDE
jgi:hypothetical protein